MKFNNILDYAKFGVLMISLCGTTALTTTYTMKQNNKEIITEMKSEMAFMHNHIENSMIRNLIKQAKKVKKDPSDIKMVDVEQVLNDWNSISNKVFYQEDFDVVNTWYKLKIKK